MPRYEPNRACCCIARITHGGSEVDGVIPRTVICNTAYIKAIPDRNSPSPVEVNPSLSLTFCERSLYIVCCCQLNPRRPRRAKTVPCKYIGDRTIVTNSRLCAVSDTTD
ncbi:hypothetical protein D3C85_1344740 [compost metagenome]